MEHINNYAVGQREIGQREIGQREIGQREIGQLVIGRAGNRFYKDTIIEVKKGTETEFYIIVTGYVQRRTYMNYKPIGNNKMQQQYITVYTQNKLYVKKLSWKFNNYRISPIDNFATKEYLERLTYELEVEDEVIKFPYRAEKIVAIHCNKPSKEVVRRKDDTEHEYFIT
jgi:hypothetical protein